MTAANSVFHRLGCAAPVTGMISSDLLAECFATAMVMVLEFLTLCTSSFSGSCTVFSGRSQQLLMGVQTTYQGQSAGLQKFMDVDVMIWRLF